jgi:outer membrane receptor for ferrienterochelin and colicins
MAEPSPHWSSSAAAPRAWAVLLLLALACLLASSARGQSTNVATQATNLPPKQADLTELPLESLMNLEIPKVYAASKVEQKTTEAPSSVTVITGEDIKRYGYWTLADLLASVQGFYVSYDRNYDFLGARGVSLGDFNDRILLLVDGHRVNNNFNDGAAIGTDFILDLGLVDRVEIIRGPGSALYGDNAFFGVINVVTRQGRQLNGLEVSGGYASFDTYRTRVTYGKLFTNGVEVLLSGSYYNSEGNSRLFYPQFDNRGQNLGEAVNMDGGSYGSFFGSLGYNDFTLEGAFIHREKTNPTAQYDLTTFDDPRLRTIDDRGYGELKFSHSFPDVMDVTADIYFDTYNHQIGYPQSLLSGTNVLFSQYSSETDVGQWWGSEVQFTKNLWDRLTLSLGGEYRDDFKQQSTLVVQNQPTEGSNIHTNRQNYGVYIQGDFAVRTNLHLEAGVRYDQYGQFEPAWDPRAALIYNPFDQSTLKAIYGTAFRAPSFYELSTSDLALQPEKITTYELVYEQGIGQYLRSSLSGFYNQMDHLLVFSSGSFTNFNADTAGMELALEGSSASGIRGRASYSFQDTHNSNVGWQMPDSPNNLFKFDLSVPVLKDKIFAGLEFQYVSDRLSLHNTTDPSGQPITVQGVTAGGYGVVNLTLFSRNLVRNLEFSASIYNLLNRQYTDPASAFHVQDVITQDGRTLRVLLTYHF